MKRRLFTIINIYIVLISVLYPIVFIYNIYHPCGICADGCCGMTEKQSNFIYFMHNLENIFSMLFTIALLFSIVLLIYNFYRFAKKYTIYKSSLFIYLIPIIILLVAFIVL